MSENTSFAGKVSMVLRQPGKGFAEVTEEDLKAGIVIIFVIGVLSAWAGSIYFSKMGFDLSRLPNAQRVPEMSAETLSSSLMPFIVIGGFLGAVTRWLIPSILIIVVAKMLIGGGSAKRMLSMTAFASLPMIPLHLIRVVDAYTITSASLAAFRAPIFPSTGLVYRFLNNAVEVFNVFGIATLVLTVYAVSENYGSSKREAANSAVLSYLLYILLGALIPAIR